MLQVCVTLRVVTPAFVGGWDHRNFSEFRLSSLKGLLRFWWRAFQVFPTTKSLFQAESEIFGSTKQSSRFSIHLDKQDLRDVTYSPGGYAFNVGRPGIRYMFFSMYRMGGGSLGRKAWIPQNTDIRLKFRFLTERTLREVLYALWLFENFGGIGSRSRRGAGSLQITEISLPANLVGIPEFMCQRWSPRTNNVEEEIEGFLSRGISALRCDSRDVADYSAYRHEGSSLRVVAADRNHTGYQTWEDAVDDIGQRLSYFRKSDLSGTVAAFQNEARALQEFALSGNYPVDGPDRVSKSAFGLPMTYHFRGHSRSDRGVIPEHVIVSGANEVRRASPLFVKIGRLPGNNRFYAVLLLLWSEFLPPEEMIRLRAERTVGGETVTLGTHDVSQPNRATIDDFLRSL